MPNEPVEAADIIADAVCDDDNTEPENSCRELVQLLDDNARVKCIGMVCCDISLSAVLL